MPYGLRNTGQSSLPGNSHVLSTLLPSNSLRRTCPDAMYMAMVFGLGLIGGALCKHEPAYFSQGNVSLRPIIVWRDISTAASARVASNTPREDVRRSRPSRRTYYRWLMLCSRGRSTRYNFPQYAQAPQTAAWMTQRCNFPSTAIAPKG